jgi:hypothetical protein
MIYKRYLILMILLISGLMAAATLFALRSSPPPPKLDMMDLWIDRLGHPDSETAQKAEDALKTLGAEALPSLKRAAGSTNPQRARRSRQLLNLLDPNHLD